MRKHVIMKWVPEGEQKVLNVKINPNEHKIKCNNTYSFMDELDRAISYNYDQPLSFTMYSLETGIELGSGIYGYNLFASEDSICCDYIEEKDY